jgi:Uma2 family endonuclease
MDTRHQANVDDLYHVPDNGKAELVNGEIVFMPPTGDMPSRAGFNIAVSLRNHERGARSGRAYPDNTGYRVNLPDREFFSPYASYYVGEHTGMKFLVGAPVFAAEVRSENDYGTAAEVALARKRADYFAAGTRVVWDVDLLGSDVIRSYSSEDPENPKVFRRGEMAHAEPALPGWGMAVDDLFD